MNNTERIIASIERALALGAIPPDLDGRELAQEYAALCMAANERLRQCVRHIESGNLRAAMHISESPPPILDYCAVLDFNGAAQWRDIARQNDWPIAETINANAVVTINNAYSSAMALDPFLKQFANAALNKNYRDCTRLLRRIIELDPTTLTWPEDLKAFEDRRIPEVMNELSLADANQDMAKLKELLSELNEKWLDPRSKALQEQAGAIAQRIQEKEAGEEGLAIVGEISKRYAAFDYKGLERSLSVYRLLLAKGYFKPTPAMAVQFEEASAWFAQEKASKEKEQEYKDNLAQLTTELEKELLDGKAIEKLWRILTCEGRSLPPDLEQRALNAIKTCRLIEQRRKRRQSVVIALTATVALASIVAVIGHVQYRSLLAFYARRLEQAVTENDRQKLLTLQADIRKHILLGRSLHRSPRIQEWLLKEDGVRTLVEDKTRRLKELLAELDRIACAGFVDDAAFVSGQAEASEILKAVPELRNSPANQQALDSMAETRRIHWESTIAKKEIELTAIITNIMGQVPSFESIERGNLEEMEQKRSVLDSLVMPARDKASELRTLYTEQEARNSGALTILESAEQELNERRKAVAERRSLIADFDNVLTLPKYFDALKVYFDRFPRDRLSQEIGNVLAYREHAEYLIAPPLSAPAELNTAQLELISDNTPIENYFWKALLKSEADSRKGIVKWSGIKNSILAFKDDNLMVGLMEFTFVKSANEHIRVFAYDDFGNQKTGVPGMRTYDLGVVYVPKAEDTGIEFKSVNHGIPSSQIVQQKKMAHCEALINLIAEAEKVNAAQGSVFLLKAAFEMAANTNILNGLLRLRLAQIFLGNFIEMVGEGVAPKIDDALKNMQATDDGTFDPFCIKNPFVIDAAKKADEVMRANFRETDITDILSSFQFQAAIRRECVRRGIQWIGYVDFKDPTILHQLSGKKILEIWVLRPGAEDKMNVLAAAESGPAGKYMIGEKLIPGEALFAPAAEDGQKTRDILARIFQETDAQPKAPKNVAWPRVWPANRRQY